MRYCDVVLLVFRTPQVSAPKRILRGALNAGMGPLKKALGGILGSFGSEYKIQFAA